MSEQNLQSPVRGERPKADWGRMVVDAIKVGRLTGGGGLLMAEDVSGTSISKKKAWPKVRPLDMPMLFDLRVVSDGDDGYNLMIYMPDDQVETAVRRNGYIVNNIFQFEPNAGGWAVLQPYIAIDKKGFVTITFANEAHSGGVYGCGYAIAVQEEEPTADRLPRGVAYTTPVTIGIIDNGKILQFHRGELATYYTHFDSDAVHDDSVGFFSLEYLSEKWEAQLYGFRAIENIITLDFGDYEKSSELDDIDFVLRKEYPEGDIKIEYTPARQLVAYINNQINNSITNIEPNTDPYGLLELPEGNYIYNAETDSWEDADSLYWVQGGDASTCYGSNIGNNASATVIDLDGAKLKGDNWEILDGNDKRALDMRGLWAIDVVTTSAVRVMDWQAQKLYHTNGDVVVNWANQEILSAEGGFNYKSIEWKARKLYPDNTTAWSVNWQECKLATIFGVTTLNWSDRLLSGDWSVAAGGSIDTPKLKVAGVEYKVVTEVINGTSYKILVQV